MNPRAPMLIVLEPAHVSLLRLGREMGRGDVPAAEPVRESILSAEASRAVDRAVAEAERAELDRVEDDLWRGMFYGKTCYSCGAHCTPFGTRHAEGCDLDRTLTAKRRYQLRNLERRTAETVRQYRYLKIRRRWAILNGRCGKCIDAPVTLGRKHCATCLEIERMRQGESRAAVREEREAA